MNKTDIFVWLAWLLRRDRKLGLHSQNNLDRILRRKYCDKPFQYKRDQVRSMLLLNHRLSWASQIRLTVLYLILLLGSILYKAMVGRGQWFALKSTVLAEGCSTAAGHSSRQMWTVGRCCPGRVHPDTNVHIPLVFGLTSCCFPKIKRLLKTNTSLWQFLW